MNDLPTIDPTGAMASGEYTDYMIGYNNLAEDVIADNLTEASAMKTMEDWYLLWGRILGEVNTRVTTIESSVQKLYQQIKVIDSKIKKM
jgi:hypothetical protein